MSFEHNLSRANKISPAQFHVKSWQFLKFQHDKLEMSNCRYMVQINPINSYIHTLFILFDKDQITCRSPYFAWNYRIPPYAAFTMSTFTSFPVPLTLSASPFNAFLSAFNAPYIALYRFPVARYCLSVSSQFPVPFNVQRRPTSHSSPLMTLCRLLAQLCHSLTPMCRKMHLNSSLTFFNASRLSF